ncbi:MAG TPA: CarD family transcriptional regulator, partial [Gemmatimonadaceae bacterium]
MALPSILDAVERLAAFGRVSRNLPGPRATTTVAGLQGSSDAVAIAALVRAHPTRFFVVATDGVPEAERWLADLGAIVDEPETVALYPPRESLGEAEPHAEIAGERVETLERLSRGAVRVLLTTARALLERTRLPRAVAASRLELRKGDVWKLGDLVSHLESVGYERVTMVEDVAQFSVRGGIVDIYGFGMTDPVRAELWGDEIVELRHFDLNSQRSTRAAEVALVLPSETAPPEIDEEEGNVERVSIGTLFPPDTLLVLPEGTDLARELERNWQEAAHHIDLARRRGEDAASRAELFDPPAEVLSTLRALGTIGIVDRATAPEGAIVFPLQPPDQIDRDIPRLRRLVRTGMPTMILCDNAGQCERLDELLTEGEYGASPAALVVGVLHGGFVIPPSGATDPGLRILTDHEIFRRERRLRRARRYAAGAALDVASALTPGDYVVHLEHGIGIYRGIVTTFVQESAIEVAVIEYEGGDKLNVPLYRLDLVERYRAAGDVSSDAPPPRLHKLGGKRWQQQREKTRAAIQEMTLELLDLYARRKVASRPPHVPDTAWQRQLESSFLFEDTPDQRKATGDVKGDMEGPRPMDRLLVGDVGYG